MRKILIWLIVTLATGILLWSYLKVIRRGATSAALVKKQSAEVAKLRQEVAPQVQSAGKKIAANKDLGWRELNTFDLSTRQGALGIIDLLRLVDQNTRYQIYERLNQVTDRSLISILHEMLWDQSPYVRQAAAMILAKFHDPSSMKVLKEYVDSSDPEGWRKAVQESRLSEEESEGYFYSLAYGIMGLGEIGDDEAAEAVAKHLDARIQLQGVGDVVTQALGKMGAKGLEVIEKRKLERSERREKLGEAIGSIRGAARIPELISKMEDKTEDPQIRGRAAIALGLMKGRGVQVEVLKKKGVEEALLAGTKDTAKEVRLSSYSALLDVDLKKYASVLIDALKSETDGTVQDRIIRDLGQYRVEEAVPVLEGFLTNPDDNIKMAARQSLKQLTGKKYKVQVTRADAVGELKREVEMEKEAEFHHQEALATERYNREVMERERRAGKIK